MKRHLSILAAATAIAACSSDPSSAVPTTYASNTYAAPAAITAYTPDTSREAAALDIARLATPDASPLAAPERELEQRAAPAAIPVRGGSCDIVVERTSNGVLLTAVADVPRRADGEYSFIITKSGKGGSSDINQGGPLDGARGGHVELGAAEVSLERGASYRATLKLTSDGREICRRVKRS